MVFMQFDSMQMACCLQEFEGCSRTVGGIVVFESEPARGCVLNDRCQCVPNAGMYVWLECSCQSSPFRIMYAIPRRSSPE